MPTSAAPPLAASSAMPNDTMAPSMLKREWSLFAMAGQNVPRRSTSTMGLPGRGRLFAIPSLASPTPS